MRYMKIIRSETRVLVAVLVVLLVIVAGVSYAMYTDNKSNTDNQVITTGTLQVEYSTKNGYIDNETYKGIIPKANSVALSEDGYEFSIKNTGTFKVTYNVYLYINSLDYENDKNAGKISGDLFTNLELLKYNLQTNNDNNKEIKNVSDQYIYEEDGISKYELLTGTIEGNEINNYNLRLWLSEDADISEINKYVYLKLEVSSYISGQEPVKEKKYIENPICIKAKSLHTETCSQTSNYCAGDGYESGSTITYGNLGSGKTFTTGDAFDCDVNGDGTYDEETERFYYVTDMNSDTAVLVYYNNVTAGEPNNMSTYAYNTNASSYLGPQTAMLQLPTVNQWSNVSLTNTTRDIKDENGTTRITGFSYAGYSARLLTAQEVSAGCGFTVGSTITGELSNKCQFLMENTRYSSDSLNTYGSWLENPNSSSADGAWNVSGFYRRVSSYPVSNASGIGVRPVIEVDKNKIDLSDRVEYGVKLVVDNNNNKTADIGDEVKLGNEEFYVISNNSGKVEALSKYNLNVGANKVAGEEGIQNRNAIGWITGGSNPFSASVTFSTNNGWEADKDINVKNYPGEVKEALYGTNGYEKYVRRLEPTASVRLLDKTDIEALINNKTELAKNPTIQIKNLADAKGYPWLYSTTYFLQTAYDDVNIWSIISDGRLSNFRHTSSGNAGVRPVITYYE